MRTLTAALAVLMLCAGTAAAEGNQQQCQNLANTIAKERKDIKSMTTSLTNTMMNLAKAQTALGQAKTPAEKAKAQAQVALCVAMQQSLSKRINQTSTLLKMNQQLAQSLHCPDSSQSSAPSSENCPSNLFAHNSGGGLRQFSCVASCPEGTHPSAPGDFPYKGARACMRN